MTQIISERVKLFRDHYFNVDRLREGEYALLLTYGPANSESKAGITFCAESATSLVFPDRLKQFQNRLALSTYPDYQLR